jgi:hypothetical protein
MSNAEMSSVMQEVTKACSAAMNRRLQELTIELPSRPLRVAADPEKVVEALVLVLLDESEKSPAGSELVVAVTASDFALKVCVSSPRAGPQPESPSGTAAQVAASGHGIAGAGTAHDSALAEAWRTIVAIGGTLQTWMSAGTAGRQLVVALPLTKSTRARDGRNGRAWQKVASMR